MKKEYKIVSVPRASQLQPVAQKGKELVTRLVGKALSMRPASKELRAQRLEICNTCPERRSVTLRDKTIASVCGKCGCVCEAKAAIQASSCPISKW